TILLICESLIRVVAGDDAGVVETAVAMIGDPQKQVTAEKIDVGRVCLYKRTGEGAQATIASSPFRMQLLDPDCEPLASSTRSRRRSSPPRVMRDISSRPSTSRTS